MCLGVEKDVDLGKELCLDSVLWFVWGELERSILGNAF
jgi:hypothetical protein